MERVVTLLQNLQQQINENLPIDRLLLTVQMVQHELTHLQANQPLAVNNAVTLSMPLQMIAHQQSAEIVAVKSAPEEKTIEILQVDEAAVQAELEEIKRNATAIQHLSAHTKFQTSFEPSDVDIPTFVHQNKPLQKKEVNDLVGVENKSINDSLKEVKTELSTKLSDSPVKDLKKAIGVNDRFLFMNELFRGDEAMYEHSIKTINSFTIWPEAEYWIRRELKTKLGWKDSHETVLAFDQLIRRRFS